MATMESLQLAQMAADISELKAAQENQARALVNANKTTGSTTSPPTDRNQPPELLHPERPSLRHHQRTGSNGSAASTGSSFLSRTASPAKFDKLGRRILTPPNTRTSSAYGSIPGTPRGETEVDEDVDRASTLMALYEIRAKVKDQDTNRNLSKLREKIAALHAKQVQAERKEGVGATRFTYPKSS